jgi:hypothetical protein
MDEENQDSDDEDDADYTPASMSNPFAKLSKNKPEEKKPARQAAARASNKIFTLSEMNKDSDEEGEEKGQAFYAGGSEHR